MKRTKAFIDDHKYVGICLIAVLLVLFSCIFVSFARYALDIVKNHFLMTQNFYFSSNKLEEETAEYAIEHWSGTSAYDINITMQNTANLLVKTTKDINYNVKCEALSTDTVNKDDISCSISGDKEVSRTLSKDSTNDSFVVTMNYTGSKDLKENDSIKIKVTATSSSPYVKELSGTFEVFVGYYGVTYKIEDENNQVYLNSLITNAKNFYVVQKGFSDNGKTFNEGTKVSVEDYNKLSSNNKKNCASAIITLSWDAKDYRIDTTSSAYINRDTSYDSSNLLQEVNGIKYITGLRFYMDAESSMAVKFYKININKNNSYPDRTDSPVISYTDSIVVK